MLILYHIVLEFHKKRAVSPPENDSNIPRTSCLWYKRSTDLCKTRANALFLSSITSISEYWNKKMMIFSDFFSELRIQVPTTFTYHFVNSRIAETRFLKHKERVLLISKNGAIALEPAIS